MHNIAFAQFIKAVILAASMGGMEPTDAEISASVKSMALYEAFTEGVPVQEAVECLKDESPADLLMAGRLKAVLK